LRDVHSINPTYYCHRGEADKLLAEGLFKVERGSNLQVCKGVG
jgi:hypothetical protein